MKKFCFVCGKETSDLTDGRCKSCYADKLDLISVPEAIEIDACSKCPMYKLKHKWLDIQVKDIILDKIKVIGDDVEISIKNKHPNYEVIASNKKKKEVHKVRVKISKQICPICARKFTQYYEAVLQIRGNYKEKVIDIIEDELFNKCKEDKKAFHTLHEVTGGVDVRIGSKSAAWNIAEMLKKKYKCEVKRSYELIGKKKGKEIYRSFTALRF